MVPLYARIASKDNACIYGKYEEFHMNFFYIDEEGRIKYVILDFSHKVEKI